MNKIPTKTLTRRLVKRDNDAAESEKNMTPLGPVLSQPISIMNYLFALTDAWTESGDLSVSDIIKIKTFNNSNYDQPFGAKRLKRRKRGEQS